MIKMVLGDDQLYYVSLCEDHHSIRLAITPDEDGIVTPQGLQERWKLIEEFHAKLMTTVKAFMPSSDLPQRYIPCSLCPKLHLKLDKIRADGKALRCINGKLPKDYYSDLRQYQGNIYICIYCYAVTSISDTYIDTDGAKITGKICIQSSAIVISLDTINFFTLICFLIVCIVDFTVIAQKGK